MCLLPSTEINHERRHVGCTSDQSRSFQAILISLHNLRHLLKPSPPSSISLINDHRCSKYSSSLTAFDISAFLSCHISLRHRQCSYHPPPRNILQRICNQLLPPRRGGGSSFHGVAAGQIDDTWRVAAKLVTYNLITTFCRCAYRARGLG